MSTEQIQEIELNIQEAKKIVAIGDSLERLRHNVDFKKVISEGFFKEEAIRLVHLKADQNMQTPERQQSIIRQMDAIGALNDYFQTLFYRADMAQKAIEADEQARDEILQEELA